MFLNQRSKYYQCVIKTENEHWKTFNIIEKKVDDEYDTDSSIETG